MDERGLPHDAAALDGGTDDLMGHVVIRPHRALHVLYLAWFALLAAKPVQQYLAGDYVEPLGLLWLLPAVVLGARHLAQRSMLSEDGIAHRAGLVSRHHSWDEVTEVVLPADAGWWERAHLRIGRSRVEISGLLVTHRGDDALRVAVEMARRHGVAVRMKGDDGVGIFLALLAVFATVMVLLLGAVAIYG